METNLRQTRRREEFNAAFERMPLWETWTDERPDPRKASGFRTVNHCKVISRRVRRSMARVLVKRQRAATASAHS